MRRLLAVFLLIVAISIPSWARSPIATHQGNGIHSFIPQGFNSVRDFQYMLGRSARLQQLYSKQFGSTYDRLGLTCWEYWCLSRDMEATVYCVDSQIYSTRQILPKGTPVIGYRDVDGNRRAMIVADCGNPLTRYLLESWCPPIAKKTVEKPIESVCLPPPPEEKPVPQPVPICLVEPKIGLPNRGINNGIASAYPVRVTDPGIINGISAAVILPLRVASTNVTQIQGQQTGPVNVENNADNSNTVGNSANNDIDVSPTIEGSSSSSSAAASASAAAAAEATSP